MRTLVAAFAIFVTLSGSVPGSAEVIPISSYKGLLWNSVNKGLTTDDLSIRFSKILVNGNLAPLVSVYGNAVSNDATAGALAYVGYENYKIEAPAGVFLNVDTGSIITNTGAVIGVSYSQQPDSFMSYGFEFFEGTLSIYEASHRVLITP